VDPGTGLSSRRDGRSGKQLKKCQIEYLKCPKKIDIPEELKKFVKRMGM